MVEAVEEEVSQEGRRGRPSEIRTPSIGGDGGGVGGGGRVGGTGGEGGVGGGGRGEGTTYMGLREVVERTARGGGNKRMEQRKRGRAKGVSACTSKCE